MKKINIIILLFILASCSHTIEEVNQIGKKPELSKISPPVNWVQDQDANYVKTSNSLWQPGSREFFRDHKARRIGDILKVKVKINDKATLNNKTATSRSSKTDMGIGGLFGLQSQLHKVIPMPEGAPLVGTNGGSNNVGSGDIDRKEDIEAEVAAMVKQILPNGNLVIEGHQEIRINYEVRELSVTGIVRPDDISAENSVSADQIAEARISYGGRGTISKMQQPKYGTQFLEAVVPW